MRLVAPVTKGYFFSLSALCLVVASCLNISKKKISSGTQGILSQVIGLNYDDTLIIDFFSGSLQ